MSANPEQRWDEMRAFLLEERAHKSTDPLFETAEQLGVAVWWLTELANGNGQEHRAFKVAFARWKATRKA